MEIQHEINTTGPGAAVEDTESASYLSAERAESLPLYGSDAQKIGHIHRIMINKKTGQIDYAIVTDAGIFGFGTYLQVRWTRLQYAEEHGGFKSDVTVEELKADGSVTADMADMQIW